MSDPGRPAPHAQGTLEKRPLAHLLAYVYERRLTGSLVFGDPDAPAGSVFVRNGEPMKAECSAPLDVWDGLAELPATTPFAYFEAYDALADQPIAEVPALSAILSVLRRRAPTQHVEAALKRLGDAPLALEPAVAVGSLGLGAAGRDALEQLRADTFTIDDVRAAPALRAQADLLVYTLLITKAARVANAGSSGQIPAPPPSSSSDVSAPSSGDMLAAADASAPVGRVKLTRTSQKLTPLKEEPTVISSYDDRASVPPPPRKSPNPELAARRKEIVDRAAIIDTQNYFEMLGVSQTTPAAQVQTIFLTLAKKWHPDRVPPELADVRDACAKVFARLSEASSTLTNDEQRARYMRLLDEGGATPQDQEKIAAVVDAATSFQKAEVLLKRGDNAKAEELCLHAVRLDAQPDYTALLAWIESLKPENQAPEPTRALEARLTTALEQNDRCERAHFYRAMLRKRLGDADGAVEDFRRAFELNPRNLDAQREVRVFEMRHQKDKEKRQSQPSIDAKPSFIGRLFKK